MVGQVVLDHGGGAAGVLSGMLEAVDPRQALGRLRRQRQEAYDCHHQNPMPQISWAHSLDGWVRPPPPPHRSSAQQREAGLGLQERG